jgi:hypothetical protein
MTAPDPLVCLNSRAASHKTTCGEPASAHCSDCLMCPGACGCPKPNPFDQAWLKSALESYAKHHGAREWQVPEEERAGIAAAIAPLLVEIRRLTASPDPAHLPSARDLVDAWNRRAADEQLALADRFLELQRHALRCAQGRCTTKETRHV